MRILTIETTLEACSVALLNNKKITSDFKLCPRQQTKYILPMISKILKKNKLKLKNLDAIGYSRGPGNFTGVRISVGIAQSLSFANQLPLIAMSTLSILAQGAWRISKINNIISIIDARMEQVYYSQYHLKKDGDWIGSKSGRLLAINDVLIKIKKLSNKWTIVGHDLKIFSQFKDSLNILKHNEYLPTAKDMIPFAIKSLINRNIHFADKAKPIYLKN